MSLRYLSMNDYLRRSFVLGKINVSTQIYSNLSRALPSDLRTLTNVALETKGCYYHENQMQLSFEVQSSAQLAYQVQQSGSKDFHSSDPARFLFLLDWDETSSSISQLIPVEYCSYRRCKVRNSFGHRFLDFLLNFALGTGIRRF